jgi:hypothetical protein
MKNIKNNPGSDAPCANCGLGMLELAVIVCAAILIAVSIFSMIGLKELQRDKYRYALDAMAVNDGIGICVELSRLVSDAEHGRNPKKLKTIWDHTKRKLLDVVGYALAAAEVDDKPRMAEADRALHTFIDLFERRMPTLQSDTANPEARDALEARLDEQAGKLNDLLWDHESALHKKAKEADEAYESKFDAIMWLVTGIFLLVAWLVFRAIGESREIDRSPRSGAWR